MRPDKLAAISFAVVLSLPAPGVTQNPPQPPASTLKVYARETIVDVTVTDAKGNPVHGLTKENFAVKEDNKPQPIHSFAEFGNIEPEDVALPNLPPNVYTNRQPPPAGNAVNVFLLDFLNIAALPGIDLTGAEDAQGRSIAAMNAVKHEAKKYVASMAPGTRVIALGLSNSLRTLQGSTSDPDLLSASFDTLAYNADGHSSTTAQYCMQAEQHTRMTIEALNQIAASLSGVPGKKNLLWFSVGIPWLTDPNARPECLPDYSSDLLKTFGLFTAAQIAIYPIDARGAGGCKLRADFVASSPPKQPGFLQTFLCQEKSYICKIQNDICSRKLRPKLL